MTLSIMFWKGIGDPDNTWILEKDLRRVLQRVLQKMARKSLDVQLAWVVLLRLKRSALYVLERWRQWCKMNGPWLDYDLLDQYSEVVLLLSLERREF